MRFIVSSLLLLILASCANTQLIETPVVANTKVIATSISTSPTATTIPSITPTITFAPEIPCDPSLVNFCIAEGHFILRRPIQPPGNDLIDPVYGYGSTANGTREPHHGVEFSNPSGTLVRAAAEGTVIFAGPDREAIYSPWSDFYGNLVVIQHKDDLFTLYAHLSRIDVRVDQKVLAGDKIGEVGRTGGAIGSHLHFEVRRGDVEDYFATQNPELWLTPARDATGNSSGTLTISVVDGAGNLAKEANFTFGYYSNPPQGPDKVYYVTSYSPDMLLGEESAGLSELSAGQ